MSVCRVELRRTLAYTPAARASWQGGYIHVPRPQDPFLHGCLFPWLVRESAAGRLHRFFFLRVDHEGPAIRLRVMTGREASWSDVQASLVLAIQAFDGRHGSGPISWSEQPYSRARDYFGENMASVYSELLNAATSRLCIRLSLAARRPRVERWLTALAVVYLIHSLAARTPGDVLRALDQAYAFATEQLAKAGFDRRLDGVPHPVLDHSVRAAIAHGMAAWTGDPAIRRTARLMARARRNHVQGHVVATHAMHLLLNKVGLSVAEEQYLVQALRRMAPRAGWRHP